MFLALCMPFSYLKDTLCSFIITACVYHVKYFSTTLCRLLILRM
nr:MAG TPA: hypothetical protein [Caudoviricetes sp.]